MKKLLSTILALTLILTLAPAALAEEDADDVPYAVEGGNIYFDKATGTITGADGITAADIPATIDGVAVKEIGEAAFSYCNSLASVTIPDSVTVIGKGAFLYCEGLSNIFVDSGNPSFMDKEGILFSADGKKLIAYPAGRRDESYSIPSGTTTIDDYAFALSSLASITIPDGVEVIGDSAFIDCLYLTSVTLPDSVKVIGNNAFSECHSLSSITIPDGVEIIGEEAFRWCPYLSSITIPGSVTKIGRAAFLDSDLFDIYYNGTEEQWKTIGGENTEYDPSVTTVHFSSSVPSTPSDKEEKCDGGEDCLSGAFSDLDVNAWYHEYTDYVIGKAIMNGDNGLFRPHDSITRAELATVLWNLCGNKATGNAVSFTDVADGTWYTQAVRWAAGEGIVNGYEDGSFRPNRVVTREELATMLYRYAKKADGAAADPEYVIAYDDADKIGAWAREAMSWCVENGIVQGSTATTIEPAKASERCQVATMLTRYLMLEK